MDLSNLIWTDVDNLQFANQVNDKTWEYFQLKNKTPQQEAYFNKYQGNIPQLIEDMKHDKELLEFINNPRNWYNDTICIDDYDSDDIGEIVSMYGINTNDDSYNQLVCEGIFETYYISDEDMFE